MDFNEFYTYDDGLLISKATGQILCNLDRDGYIRVRKNGKEYRAHRIIWEMFNGPIPEGLLVDHIDGDVFNNRIENLRLATRQQNNANRKNTTDLPKGVSRSGTGYRARISHNKVVTCLGTYPTIDEASKAYEEAAEILNGEYAFHNSSKCPQ